MNITKQFAGRFDKVPSSEENKAVNTTAVPKILGEPCSRLHVSLHQRVRE